VSVNDDGVTTSMLAINCEDDCIDELRVLSISSGRAVDVIEFEVASISIDA
jgi:hypothetical protein